MWGSITAWQPVAKATGCENTEASFRAGRHRDSGNSPVSLCLGRVVRRVLRVLEAVRDFHHGLLDAAKLYRDSIGVAETEDIPTGGRQHRDADRVQFAGDGLAVECRHTDAEAIDVRHLTLGHFLQPQASACGGEPDALGCPVSGGLHAEKLA